MSIVVVCVLIGGALLQVLAMTLATSRPSSQSYAFAEEASALCRQQHATVEVDPLSVSGARALDHSALTSLEGLSGSFATLAASVGLATARRWALSWESTRVVVQRYLAQGGSYGPVAHVVTGLGDQAHSDQIEGCAIYASASTSSVIVSNNSVH
ncbi:MAG: hypothetical protein ACYDHP_09025 [Ferrimicrobium sp.]